MTEKYSTTIKRFQEVMDAMPPDYRGRVGVEFWQIVAPHIHPGEEGGGKSDIGLNKLVASFVVGDTSPFDTVFAFGDYLKQTLHQAKRFALSGLIDEGARRMYRTLIRDSYAFRQIFLHDRPVDPTLILLKDLEKIIDGPEKGLDK